MIDDRLRELGKELPWERPDEARRAAVRASLLLAATDAETAARPSKRRRLISIGGAFAAGALAAAVAAIIIIPGDRGPDRDGSSPTGSLPGSLPGIATAAQITTSSTARLEHGVIATGTGIDEIVRVRDGRVRLDVARVRPGDHVRVRTDGAEVEGTLDYEVVVVADSLSAVTVRSGTAEIRIAGQRSIMLATGETWRSSVITADLTGSATSPSTSADSRTADNRTADSRTLDSRTLDSRTPDNRTADNQTADSRTADNRTADNRTADSRTADNRTAVDQGDGVGAARGGRRAPGPIPSTLGDQRDGVGPPDAVESTPPAISSTAAGSGTGAAAAGRVRTVPRSATATERHFRAGWALLRDGKASQAAVELGAAADASPGDPLAVDARYFEAVALVRAGQGKDAERAVIAFLDAAPRSLRRGRASVMLARLIAVRGDVASARAWFRSAIDDPDPAIAAAARAGLASLEPSAR